MKLLLDYGKEKIPVLLPEGIELRELKAAISFPAPDPIAEINRALNNPLASPPLREVASGAEKICIIVNDTTRVARSELFLPCILDELEAGGAALEKICILFANGSHRPLSRGEMVELVGAETGTRVAMFNHDAGSPADNCYLGETARGTPVLVNRLALQADLRILTGSIVYHYFAGFGGGRKALIPGVAGLETIRRNHSLLLQEGAATGALSGNPLHEDLLEAAHMAGGGFLFNVVLNEQKEILGAFAGDMVEAHQQGCTFAEKVYGVQIGERADIVIASCGGWPKDINLYQAHKALDNAIRAVKPGGDVVLLARCSEGIGSALFAEWINSFVSVGAAEEQLRANFVLGGHKAFTVGRLLQQARVYLLSELPADTARRLGFIPITSPARAVQQLFTPGREKGREKPLFYLMPQASLTVPIPAAIPLN